MGSSQPSDVNLPFGYALDSTTQEYLFANPPDPPQGQPILSDNENKLISSFFEDMTSDNYTNATLGEGLNFTDDWLNLPPQFMGTATSYGQHPPAVLESPLQQNLLTSSPFQNMMPPASSPSSVMVPPPPATTQAPFEQQQQQQQQQQQHSEDVLAVAALLRNGSLSRASENHHTSAYPNRNTGPPMGPPVGHFRHQAMAEFREDGRRMSHQPAMSAENQSNTFGSAIFSAPTPQMAAVTRTHPPSLPVDVQWGSDSNFGRHFMPQSDKETSEALEEKRMTTLNCLEVSRSAANTRPSSPAANGDLSSPLRLKTRNPIPAQQVDDFDTPPRKRRKSKVADRSDGAEDDELSPAGSAVTAKPAGRKRKSKSDALSTTPFGAGEAAAAAAASRRRKSATNNAASKLPRENLSEEQKRENHIRSEQKRRTLIKEGFDDLCEIVPGLRGGGFSKSTMLSMASEWLDELLEGNEQLKAQLAGLARQ